MSRNSKFTLQVFVYVGIIIFLASCQSEKKTENHEGKQSSTSESGARTSIKLPDSLYVDFYHGFGLILPEGIHAKSMWRHGERIEFIRDSTILFIGEVRDYKKEFTYYQEKLDVFLDTLKTFAFNKSDQLIAADGPCSSDYAVSDSIKGITLTTSLRLFAVYLTGIEERWPCELGDTSYVNKKIVGPVFWADLTRSKLNYALEITPYYVEQFVSPTEQQLIIDMLNTLWLIPDNDLKR